MKQETGPSNTITKDPVEQLFDGVAFRNGGKAEAIRRVRMFVAQNTQRTVAITMEVEHRRREELQQRLNAAEARGVRLQRAIRQINIHRSDEIIEAIERPVPNAGRNFDTIEETAKAARG